MISVKYFANNKEVLEQSILTVQNVYKLKHAMTRDISALKEVLCENGFLLFTGTAFQNILSTNELQGSQNIDNRLLIQDIEHGGFKLTHKNSSYCYIVTIDMEAVEKTISDIEAKQLRREENTLHLTKKTAHTVNSVKDAYYQKFFRATDAYKLANHVLPLFGINMTEAQVAEQLKYNE